MTTDLHSILSKLGLAQYIDRFDGEGFETWETVLDITESDLYVPTLLFGSFAANTASQRRFGSQTWA